MPGAVRRHQNLSAGIVAVGPDQVDTGYLDCLVFLDTDEFQRPDDRFCIVHRCPCSGVGHVHDLLDQVEAAFAQALT
ncbi:hypothetical protein D3C81_1674270 [compost metagenome]